MKTIWLFICLLFWGLRVSAQDDGRIIKIPVIFHVLYTDTTEYVTRDKILVEIADANQDFQMINPDISLASADFKPVIGDAKVQFYLKDIRYIKINNWGTIFRVWDNTSFLHGLSTVIDPETCLNVYTCNIKYHGKKPEGLSPVKYLNNGSLSDDAVNIHYTKIGVHERLLTHEAGHWLGLYHTFDNNQVDIDHIADIPLQANSTDGSCKKYPPDTTEAQSNNPSFTHTNFNNFMDYSGCRVMFSKQQAARIRFVVMNFRKQIWQNSIN